MPCDLLSFARNVNSQYGEDGILEEILSRLPEKTGWAIEFGAWDGRYLSNIRRLVDESGYRGIFIEASKSKFLELVESFKDVDNAYCINRFVGYQGDDNLDVILEETPCPLSPDILSIDIDGNDIHVWTAVEKYRPKVVCIEYNPTIPTNVNFKQPPSPGCKWGSSLLALFELGVEKKYRLVCANEVNAFFVDAKLWPYEHADRLERLPQFRKREPEPVYVFAGYDGTVLLSRAQALPWHSLVVSQCDVQALPWFLRKYPHDYNLLQRKLFGLYVKYFLRLKARLCRNRNRS